MENVKIKQIKGADPEKKKLEIFFGGEGQEAERERAKKGAHPLSLSPFPFFPDSGNSLLTLAPQVEGDCGKRLPGSPVLFSRGKLWYRAHTQSLWRDFFKQPEFKSSTGQYEWEHVILTFANYNSQTQKPPRTFIYIFLLPAPFVRQPSSLALPIRYQIGNILEGGLLPFFMCGWTSQESKRPNLSASAAAIIMPLCKAANKCFTGSHQGAHFSAALAG